MQGTIEEALAQILGLPTRVTGAGRTDSGVHALGQVCSFDMDSDRDPESVQRSLSKMLSPGIRIESIETVHDDFHPIRDTVRKHYAYCIDLGAQPDPFTERYAWHVPWPIDEETVRSLAQQLRGTHDFAGFCAAGSSVTTTERTIESIAVARGCVVGPPDSQAHLRIDFTGDGFLYKMIRNLVGTMVDVARGHLPESTIAERLAAPMPYRGFTAPAKGLFLVDVEYD